MSLKRHISVSDLKKEIAKRRSSDSLNAGNMDESEEKRDHKKSAKTATTTRSPEKTKGRNQRSATLFDLSPPSSSPSPPEASVPPRADSHLRPLRLGEFNGPPHSRTGLYTTRVRADSSHPMPQPSARGKLNKTPSESRLSLPPIEHMKLCLFKLESADYTGAIFDVTQCTAFLSHSPEPDLKKIRFCATYKLALTILSEIKRRLERDTEAQHEARRSVGTLGVANKGPSSSTDTSPNESPSSFMPSMSLTRRNTELLSGPPSESLLTALLEEERNNEDRAGAHRSLPGSLLVNNTTGAPLPPGLTVHQYIALLTRCLADIALLPRHRMVCYRMAIKWNLECHNYETAARLIRVLLKKKLPDLPELEAKLKMCEENGLHDEVPVLDTQVLCCKSLRMTESYTQCKVCEVRYSDEIVPPTICIFCMMGRIAAQKDRVSPRLQSKDHL